MKIKFNIQHELDHLEKVIEYLDKPNIKLPGDSATSRSVFKKLISKIGVRLSRLRNFLFGDHHWYSNARARKLVKYYIQNVDASKKNDKQISQIICIYDRLIRLKRGKGSWGDQIKRDGIVVQQQKLNTSNSQKSNIQNSDEHWEDDPIIQADLHIPELDELLENPFLDASPEDSFEEWVPPESHPCPNHPHRFQYLNGLSNPSMKLLFHNLADAFGNNSAWEGWGIQKL